MTEFVFDREEERKAIRQRLAKKRPFLIHGPAGAGKTLLLKSALPEFPSVFYCENASTTLTVFRSLAASLLRAGSPRAQKAFRDENAIGTKSAVSLKGIVMDALNEGRGKYTVVLDHLKRPSYSFAAVVREVMGWGSTPVSAIARSSHMEDVGFLQPFYRDRSEKYEIRNFDIPVAKRFARELIDRAGLCAPNLEEFVEKMLEFTAGNPGAMLSLVEMAKFPKYRSADHIKITPLYIDFRMNWNVAN